MKQILALQIGFLLAASSVPTWAADRPQTPPQRVVSLNLCADEWLLRLADREQVASVTWLVDDPALSRLGPLAKGLHRNHGLAEEVVHLKPDLILASAWSAPTTTLMLRRLGHQVKVVPTPTRFDGIIKATREVAGWLGQDDRAAALVADIERRLQSLQRRRLPTSPRAAVLHPNAFTSPAGSLADAVLAHAGLRNHVADHAGGRAARETTTTDAAGRLTIEQLLRHPPDLLIISAAARGPSLAHRLLQHPALRARLSPTRIVAMPPALWTCPSPGLIDAVEHLVDQLEPARLAQADQ